MRGFTVLSAVAASLMGLAVAASPASATAFGPASLGFSTSLTGGATWSIGSGSGTLNFGYNPSVSSHTGNFVGVNSGTTGNSSSGSLTFSTTVGTTITQSNVNLFTFTDSSANTFNGQATAGTYTFSVTSVETTAYNYSVSESTLSLSLYILGIVAGGDSGFTGTPTSIAFDLTGFSGVSTNSGTVRNPPDSDPNPPTTPSVSEPEGWSMFAVGLAGLVVLRGFRGDRTLRRVFSRRRTSAATDVAPALA